MIPLHSSSLFLLTFGNINVGSGKHILLLPLSLLVKKNHLPTYNFKKIDGLDHGSIGLKAAQRFKIGTQVISNQFPIDKPVVLKVSKHISATKNSIMS